MLRGCSGFADPTMNIVVPGDRAEEEVAPCVNVAGGAVHFGEVRAENEKVRNNGGSLIHTQPLRQK